mgnify:FL=1
MDVADEDGALMSDIVEGDGYRAMVTCSDCPVQIEGEVDDHALYFWARHDTWRMSISKDKLQPHQKADVFSIDVMPDEHPVSQSIQGPYAFHETGTYDRSMSHARAWEIVEQAVIQFRASQGAHHESP